MDAFITRSTEARGRWIPRVGLSSSAGPVPLQQQVLVILQGELSQHGGDRALEPTKKLEEWISGWGAHFTVAELRGTSLARLFADFS